MAKHETTRVQGVQGDVLTSEEIENMGIVELFQRVVLLNQKCEGAQ